MIYAIDSFRKELAKMDNSWSWEQKALIIELVQGLELAKRLKLSGSTSSDDSKRLLVQRILASFQRSLLILNQSSVPLEQPKSKVPISSLPGSPFSVNGSPPTDDLEGGVRETRSLKDTSKKRKMLQQNAQQVRVTSHNGMEGPHEDGYSWRKYGQKDILGAKYPRSYYRCTYRSTQNCLATKKVQRSEEEPLTFEITYHGEHTCFQAINQIPAPAPPDVMEQKPNDSIYNHQESDNALSNLRAGLCVDTELLADKELASPFSFHSTSLEYMTSPNHTTLPTMAESSKVIDSYSPCPIAPATPEPDYLLQWQTDNFIGDHNFQCAESDLTGTLLAKTSNANSPMPDLDFLLDIDEIYHNLPTQNTGFLSYFS